MCVLHNVNRKIVTLLTRTIVNMNVLKGELQSIVNILTFIVHGINTHSNSHHSLYRVEQ